MKDLVRAKFTVLIAPPQQGLTPAYSCCRLKRSGKQAKSQEGNAPRGRMEKGSSICTPISSIPSNKKEMIALAMIVAHPQDEYKAKGRIVSHMIRKREVCLVRKTPTDYPTKTLPPAA
jgi:hypothetical protein